MNVVDDNNCCSDDDVYMLFIQYEDLVNNNACCYFNCHSIREKLEKSIPKETFLSQKEFILSFAFEHGQLQSLLTDASHYHMTNTITSLNKILKIKEINTLLN
ncbi:hypothetical protein QTN25_004985 [Entamoeba marina]